MRASRLTEEKTTCVFMNPRISRDSDLSKRTSVICYCVDSVSVSGDVPADRVGGPALNATCLHDMLRHLETETPAVLSLFRQIKRMDK